MGWLGAVSLKISLIEFLVRYSIALGWPVEALAVMGRILFAMLIHSLDSSSSWLLCLHRSWVVPAGCFLSRVRLAIAIKLRCILLVIAGLFNILRRRSGRASQRLRRRSPIIVLHHDIVYDVFKSPSGILLRGVLRCQPTSRFALLQLCLFQFWQVGFLS